MRLRAETLREAERAVRGIAEAAEAARGSVEALYMTPLERLRVAASLTGIGVAAASLLAGAPVYAVAPRLVNSVVNIARAGRRVRATRVSVPLRLALEEILA